MKLLIVDDHFVVREGVCRLLSAFLDFVVIDAASSREAMTLFRSEHLLPLLGDTEVPIDDVANLDGTVSNLEAI